MAARAHALLSASPLVIPFSCDRHDGIGDLATAPPWLDTHPEFPCKRFLLETGRVLAPACAFLNQVQNLGIARGITGDPKAKLLAQAVHQPCIDTLVTLAHLQAIGPL